VVGRQNQAQHNRLWIILLVMALVIALAMASALLSACGETASSGAPGGLPDRAPTVTAQPPTTPTPLPQPQIAPLAPVDWDNLEPFRAAMRPAFAGDVDAFAQRNRYAIEAELTLGASTAELHGAQRVRYTNRAGVPLDSIVFRLYPNLPALGGSMTVYDVWLNDSPVTPELAARGTALIVPLAGPLAPGDSAEVMLTFSLTAERGLNASYGQFGYQREVFSAPEWYPVLSVYDPASGWWMERASPMGDAVYAESALFEVKITAPQNVHIVLSGTEIDRIPTGDGRVTHHVVSGPMRDSVLVASPIFGQVSGSVEDIAVNVYYWPGGEGAAEQVLTIARDALRVNNATYGEYPFAEFDVVETFNYTAIEYPGVILVSDRVWEPGNAFFEVATAHEVGHQWFYSLVGSNQVDHPWIDESLTAFTEFVYMQQVYDDRRAQELITTTRDSYNAYRGTGAPDLPLNLPVSAYFQNNYGAIIYRKGPLFYQELRELLGDEVFFQALRTYVERHRYEVAQSDDILAAFEDVSGQDLDALFYEWVGEFEGLDPAVIASSAPGSSG